MLTGILILLIVVGGIVAWRYRGKFLAAKDETLRAEDAKLAAEEREKAAVTLLGSAIEEEGKAIVADDDLVAELQVDVSTTSDELAAATEEVAGIERLMEAEMDRYEGTSDEAERNAAMAEWERLNAQLQIATLRRDQLDGLLQDLQLDLAEAEADLHERTRKIEQARSAHKGLEIREEIAERRTEREKTLSAFGRKGGKDLEELQRLATKRVDVLNEKGRRRKSRREQLSGSDIQQKLAALKAKDAFAAALEARRGAASAGGDADGATTGQVATADAGSEA